MSGAGRVDTQMRPESFSRGRTRSRFEAARVGIFVGDCIFRMVAMGGRFSFQGDLFFLCMHLHMPGAILEASGAMCEFSRSRLGTRGPVVSRPRERFELAQTFSSCEGLSCGGFCEIRPRTRLGLCGDGGPDSRRNPSSVGHKRARCSGDPQSDFAPPPGLLAPEVIILMGVLANYSVREEVRRGARRRRSGGLHGSDRHKANSSGKPRRRRFCLGRPSSPARPPSCLRLLLPQRCWAIQQANAQSRPSTHTPLCPLFPFARMTA